jgi:hypothetical protein
MNECWGTGFAEHWLYVRYVHSWTAQPLRAGEVQEFLNWLLDKEAIARREGKRGRRQKNFFRGKYECLQGNWPFRQSNFTQRIYVGFQALLKTGGCTPKEAYIKLAELPSVESHLGCSRRGQWSKRTIPSLDRHIETIRSLCNKFESPFKEKLLEMRVGEYRRFQMDEAEIAERERVAQLMRKLISEGICVPCSPIPVPPDPDSSG